MTLITDYASLQSAVTEYLARDQDTTLIARIPTFIQFAEAKFNRELFVRQMEVEASTTLDLTSAEPGSLALPTDFQSMRRIFLSSVTGSPRLEYRTPTQLEEYRTSIGDVTGAPIYFTINASEIELCPSPDQAYTLEMVYRATIPALSSNSTNWLLTLAPDLYLYGALLESAPYIKEDARIQTWGLGFTTALDGVNRLGQTSAYNSGPLQVTVSGIKP